MRVCLRKNISICAIVGLALSLSNCATTQDLAPPIKGEASVQKLSIAEPGRVLFKTGHPYVGESLWNALASSHGDEEKRLERNAKIVAYFMGIKGYRVEIIGSTDDRECAGRVCFELAARRAVSIYEWLVGHGIPKERMALPVNCGSASPIANNEIEEEWSRNRGVDIGLFSENFTPYYLNNPQCQPVNP